MKRFLTLSVLFLLCSIKMWAQPANDVCGSALSTLPDGSCYAGTTVAAADNWVGTVGCQSGNHPEVWYSFVATGSQLTYNVTSGTMGNNIELVVVSSTAACAGLVIQGSACGPSPLTGTMNGLQVGTTYYYTISTSGTQGTFTTCMTTSSPPPSAGQDCPTASILCTNAPFSQASSSAGFGTQEISPTNSCWGSGGERQSKWYKFTISCSGTLGFIITPNVSTNDYDWALYNITSNPSTCGLTLTSSPVACNWSGCTGATGLDASPNTVPGVTLCGGPPGPCGGGTYARAFCNETVGNMSILNVTAGQVFALLIDNYTTSNSGFSFQFSGTAQIGPSAVFTLTSTGCGQNVTATKTCASGSNFTYFWNFGDGFTSTSAGPVSHTYASTGSYIVSLSVTDALGCTDVYSQTVSGASISSTTSVTNVSCGGGANGSIDLTPTSGSGPYTYSWSNAATTQDISGLTAGTYTVTINETSSGCTGTATATITQPPVITATASQTNVTCNGSCNGSASVVASGGTGTYTYAWAPSGGTAATATNLCAGNYTCTISSPAGCSITQSFAITQPPVITSTPSQTNITCNGSCNGSATVVAGGGTGTYTYAWAPSGGTAATATNLCAGNYTCTISSPAGCSITQSFAITQPPVITATTSQTNVTCNGSCNGSATVVAAGGTGTYTYAWAPSGGTAATATNLCAGNYTCTISSPVGCSTTQSFAITQPPVITATASQTNVTCNGSCNGSASVVAAGGTGTYTYAWAPSGGTAATASSLCAGNYTCTISSPAGCSITQSFAITQPPVITATASQTNVTCNGSCNGSASVVAAGGTGTYTYAWAPSGGTAATATNLCAGNYTCTISSPAGCSITQSFAITQPPAITSTPSQTNITCNGSCNGSASVLAAGGTGTYTYAWAPSGGTAATASSLCAGNYTCTISSPAGCSITQSFAITQPPVITATASQTNVTCNGSCDGTASVAAAGGTGTYTYAWAPSGGTAATASSLCAGNYTCTISSPAGCSITQSFAITQPPVITATTSQTNLTCNAACNGSATVTASGGTGTYTYAWAPSGGTAATASSLCAGNYTCTISSPVGCSITQSFAITQPTAVAGSATTTPATCGGNNGTATVTASGGTAGYTYLWAPSGGTGTTASGLAAGNYSCTITDANGCSVVVPATVNNSGGPTATLSSSGNISCFGGTNGTALASASGGTAPYSYSWNSSPVQTTPNATGLPAGSYTCTITDANGCLTSATVTLTEPTQLTASATSTPANCGGNNGTATVTAGGGTAGYTYVWSPTGGTGTTASSLTSGGYTCTITDANGCTTTASATVTNSSGPSATITSSGNISCFSGTNGTATATPSGGTPGYTYLWTSGGTNATENNLSAGSYTCTITDANGCTTTTSVTLTEPTPITSTVTTTDANCGASDGSATVNASGGTAGYTYAWAPVGGTNATASGIPAGAYTCTITDANGCTSTANANINNLNGPTATLVSSSDALCFGGNTGVAVADASGGTGPYNFAWSPIGGTNDTATALPSGSYTCTVTDANGCLNSVTVNITEPAQLSISATSTPASCSNNNGTATGTPTGGTNTYTYSWSSGGTSAVETNLAAGNYTLTITDSNGCSASQTVTVTQTQAITSTASSTGAACFGGLTGTATVSPATGTPPYTYSWSSGGTNATESGLAAGTYTCTITDSTGCTGTQTVTITEPTQLTATSTNGNISCFGSSDGTATITGSGGTPTYTYSWAPSGGTNATANNLGVGTYTCTMTDANGCTTTQSVTITQPTQISSTATVTPVLCNGGTTGTASVTASGGTGAYTYSWAPSGGTNANATGLGAGTYTCTITDANGCTFTQTSTVTQPNALTVSTGNGDACAGLPISISSTVTGGTGPYTYSWSNAVTTASQTVNVVQTTTFTVTVTDANGCVTTANATATVDPAPVAAFTSNAVNGFFDLGSGNLDLCFTDQSTGASVWLWDLDGTGSVSQSPCITLTAADSGQFCAVQYVTNSSGCADTAEICIQVGESYFNVPNVFTPNADNSNDVFYITNSGMQKLHCEIYDRWGILMYKWDDTAGYWDGRTQSGGLATDGVYYYAATLTDFSGKEIVLKGFVHLLRGK